MIRNTTKAVLCQGPAERMAWRIYVAVWYWLGQNHQGCFICIPGSSRSQVKEPYQAIEKRKEVHTFSAGRKTATRHHSLGDAWESQLLHVPGHICAQGNLYAGVFWDLSKAGKQLNYCYFSGWENLQLEVCFYPFLASDHSWKKPYHCSLPIQFSSHAGLIQSTEPAQCHPWVPTGVLTNIFPL